jgi:hypothetical protein
MILELSRLIENAEEHRQRYNKWCNGKGVIATNADGTDYWMGRRDEAGYFRDMLRNILTQNEIEIPAERLEILE